MAPLMIGIGLSVSNVSGGGGATTPPLQIIATRGIIPGNENNGPTNTGAHTRSDIRLLVKSAPVAATDIRMALANWKKTGAAVEQDGFNTITVDVGLEISSTNYRGDFSGSVTKAIGVADTNQFATFPTLTSLAANTSFYLRASASVASLGLLWVRSIRAAAGLDTVVENASTSQAGLTGALVTGGGSARTIGYAPYYLIGRPATPTPAVAVIGDSNDYGFGSSADAAGLYGATQQGLIDGNTKPIPHIINARSGDLFVYCDPTANPRQYDCLQYATHFIGGLGTNSVPTDSVATMIAAVTTIANYARTKVLRGKVYWRTIPPRTDAGNTTVISGYEPAGKPDQFNAALIGLIGTVLDGVIDWNDGKVYLTGGTTLTSGSGGVKIQATGLWASATYTIEGTHMTDAGVAIARETTKLLAATLT